MFGAVIDEAKLAIAKRLRELGARKGWEYRKVEAAIREGQQTVDKLASTMQRLPIQCTPDELAEAKRFFQANRRDLGLDAHGQPKDSVPDSPDLEIMVAASKLTSDTRQVFVLSKDKHFTNYSEELAARYRIGVGNIAYWGQTSMAWKVY